MTEKWFFTRDDDVVLLRGRFEADDGTIGDALLQCMSPQMCSGP